LENAAEASQEDQELGVNPGMYTQDRGQRKAHSKMTPSGEDLIIKQNAFNGGDLLDVSHSKLSGSIHSNNPGGPYKKTDAPSHSNQTDMSMKKGTTRFVLNEQEQKEFLSYDMLRPDLLDWEELKMKPTFAVKNYKDSVYRGEVSDSKRNGKGVITYTSTRVYEGEW
jgi:hypothetical protein